MYQQLRVSLLLGRRCGIYGERGVAVMKLWARVRWLIATATFLVAGGLVWASPAAQASVPDNWGFAYVNTPSGVPDINHQAGSWPPGFVVHTTPGAPGEVFVRFPQIASEAGVVHVTAVIDVAVWCQAEHWAASGPDEVVAVRCFRPGGAPVSAPFVVSFSQSSATILPAPQAYGYVRFRPGSGIVTSFNSAGAANTVTPGGTGIWKVRMPGVGAATLAGDVQVTAVNPTKPAKCELQGWTPAATGQTFVVRCYDSTTNPLATGWTLTYQAGRATTGTQPSFFGYSYDNQPANAGLYAPVPPAVNFNSAGAVNTLLRAGGGLRLASFPQIGRLPNTVLVTPVQSGPGFCNLNTLSATAPPNVTIRDVTCYTATGIHANQKSMITYASAA